MAEHCCGKIRLGGVPLRGAPPYFDHHRSGPESVLAGLGVGPKGIGLEDSGLGL